MTWRDVFDAWKLNNYPNIHKTNEFVHTYTSYLFFAFNGIVYKVMNPSQFTMKDAETGIFIKDLK